MTAGSSASPSHAGTWTPSPRTRPVRSGSAAFKAEFITSGATDLETTVMDRIGLGDFSDSFEFNVLPRYKLRNHDLETKYYHTLELNTDNIPMTTVKRKKSLTCKQLLSVPNNNYESRHNFY